MPSCETVAIHTSRENDFGAFIFLFNKITAADKQRL